MGFTSPAQSWTGLQFAPFSVPEMPFQEPFEGQRSFVTEWATGISQEECRQRDRRPVQCELLMTDPTCWETENPLPIRGECLNLSEAGLYGTVPVGHPLAVGQQYLFQLRTPERDTEPQMGTIVRTELLMGYEADRVGIGVRLASAVA